MQKAEKITILASLGSAALFSSYFLLKPYLPSFSAQDNIAHKRQQVVKHPNMRVLYSSMSFLYLQGYEAGVENLFLLRDVLEVAKPKFIALQLSEQEHINQYLPIVRNAKFYEVMKKIEYFLKTQNIEELNKINELDMSKGIENLYIFNYCRINGCKIIYADEPFQSYEQMYQAKMKLRQQGSPLSVPDNLASLYEQSEVTPLTEENIHQEVFVKRRAENYVDKVMNELKPKFSLVPDTPYKVIQIILKIMKILVGIVSKDNTEEVAKLWKEKFLSVYGHQIVEDQNQLETIETVETDQLNDIKLN